MKLKYLKDIVETETGFKIDTPNRRRNIVEIRGVYFKLCRDFTNLSTTIIGETVGRDHSTVLYSLKNLDNWMMCNDKLRELYDRSYAKAVTLRSYLNNSDKNFTDAIISINSMESKYEYRISALESRQRDLIKVAEDYKQLKHKYKFLLGQLKRSNNKLVERPEFQLND